MPVDIDKVNKARAAASKESAEFFTFEQGDTLIYVCPPPPRVEGVPFLEASFHYQTRNHGEGKGVSFCLDAEANPLLKDENFLRLLKRAGRDIDDLSPCHLCKAADDDDTEEKVRKRIKRRSSYLFNIIPMMYRKRPTSAWVELDEGVRTLSCSFTIWDGICSAFGDVGDISDPRAAVLVHVHREGKDLNTRYSVQPDPKSLKAPLRLPKELRIAIRAALKEEGSGDVMKSIANMTQDSTRQLANWKGMKVDESVGDDDDDKDEHRKPECYGEDYDLDEKKCDRCEHKRKCKELSASRKPDDDEDDKPKAKSEKPKKPPVEDDDDDDDDEEEKPKRKAEPVDDDDDDDEPAKKSKPKADDDDDDDDEPKAKPKAKADKPKPKADDDDDDDEDEKPKAKKPKADDDDDDKDPFADIDEKIRSSLKKKGKG